ncbi:MAG: hypothetical protein CM1200mP10_23490 [Candidatus Neomarinimicrobiota bacterium]|nr:MAG: hypothetical protein CM1200mP10_23490 [Candidatus Neomarinimicrobiota bacterium]
MSQCRRRGDNGAVITLGNKALQAALSTAWLDWWTQKRKFALLIISSLIRKICLNIFYNFNW